jgi:chromosome segregation ATPase
VSAGVVLVTGIGVQRLYSEQLRQAHSRYGHLRDDHQHLQQHVQHLEAQLEDINMRRSGEAAADSNVSCLSKFDGKQSVVSVWHSAVSAVCPYSSAILTFHEDWQSSGGCCCVA